MAPQEHQRNNKSRTGKSPLYAAANAAAQQHVQQWLQSTLRAVAEEAWHLRCKEIAADTSVTDSGVTNLVISKQDCEDCLDLVRRFKEAWKEQLLLPPHPHRQVAEWLEQVYQKGSSSLWTAKNNDMDVPNKSIQSQRKSQEENPIDSASAQELDEREHDTTTEPLAIPYCKLQKLPGLEPTIERFKPIHPPTTLATIRALGDPNSSSAMPTSYWPKQFHQAAEEVAQRLPDRLRPDRGSTLHRQLQVLPKSIWEKKRALQQGPQSEDTTVHSEDCVSAALSTEDTDKPTSPDSLYHAVQQKMANSNQRRWKKRSIPKRSKASTDESYETARPPSDISSRTVYLPNETWNPGEKERLDALIHKEDEEPSDGALEATATLFGALSEVGKIHTQLSNAAFPPRSDMTDKQRRRLERAYFKERLFPNQIESNRDPKKCRSKVLRSERAGDSESHMETVRSMELDLGWCLLERQLSGGEKEFLAFSSAEITLEESPS